MKHKELIGKLKPFWEAREELARKFREGEAKIENNMNKKLNLGIKLEFFYGDCCCCGIGAAVWEDRKKFPLVQDIELR